MNIYTILNKIIYPDRKCRYYTDCDYKSVESFTCNHLGGPYCGKWKTGDIKRKIEGSMSECLVAV